MPACELLAASASSADGLTCSPAAAAAGGSADGPQASEHSIEQVDPRAQGWTRRKWFNHLVPYLVVLSGEDFINEFGLDGHLTSVGWGAVSRMLIYKEGRIYGSWQITPHL